MYNFEVVSTQTHTHTHTHTHIYIYIYMCVWKLCQVLNNNPQGSRLRGRPKTDGRITYKHTLITAKALIGKRGQ
jgi:hypothetical protein